MRFLTAGLLLLASCTAPSGTLRVATDTNRPPLAFLDQKKLTGFEVELTTALAEALGEPVEFVTVPEQGFLSGVAGFGILSGLDRNEYDIVLTSTPISNDLRGRYGVSEPSLNAGPVLVTAWNGPTNLDAWTGTLGMTSQAASGPVGRSDARSSLRWYYGLTPALDDLTEGRLTAVAADLGPAAAALADNERYRALLHLGPPLDEETLHGFIVRKGDPLLDRVNTALAALRSSGLWDRLHRKWLE